MIRAWLRVLTGTVLVAPLLASSGSLYGQSPEGQWKLVQGGGHPTKRHENAYAAVNDQLYLLGGRGKRPVEAFDPDTGQWETRATPPLSMHHFQAVPLNGKIYVVGAFNGGYPGEDPISHVYIYHPKSDKWTRGAKIPEHRRRGSAGAVAHNGKIYVVGGIQDGHRKGQVRWFDVFDPQTGEWQTLPNAPRCRDHFQAVIIDNKLYAAGGRRTAQATGQTFNLTIPEVDVYDFETKQWKPLPPRSDLPTERAGTTSVAVGQHLIVIGGESAAQPQAHAEVEAMHTDTGHWRSLAELNQGRHGMQAVVHANRIYVAAGSKVRGAREIHSQEVCAIPQLLQGENE
jgi:N-acetylneuraminic acid mutarotase